MSAAGGASDVAAPFPLGPALVFCPGDRPDRFGKAAERADAVILDLEDAVAAADKQTARTAVAEAVRTAASTATAGVTVTGAASTSGSAVAGTSETGLAVTPGSGVAGTSGSAVAGTSGSAVAGTSGSELAGHGLDLARTVVRVNAPGAHFAADVAALANTGVRYVMLPKAERTEDVDRLVAAMPQVGVVALCETARGVLAAPELAAHPAVVALMWGGEDLVASLGGTSSRRDDGTYRDVVRHARSTVLLAARAHGRGVIDAIYTDIADAEGQRAEAQDAAASGFTATACIHPGQVPHVRSAYSPTESEAAWSRRVLAAAQAAGAGVFEFEGRMVDEPILRHARLLAGRSTHKENPR